MVPIVGIDLRATEEGFKAHAGRGTGRYVSELASRLTKLSSKEIEIRPFHTKDIFPQGSVRELCQRVPFGRQTLETHLFLPRALPRLGVNLMHFFSHGDAPSSGNFPYVISVLDLIPLRFPELYRPKRSPWRYDLARYLERRAIQRAAGILAISEATKRDLVNILDVHPDRIFVTPLAVSGNFQVGDGSAYRTKLQQRYSIPQDSPLFLYVGGVDGRKNIKFLLETLQEISSRVSPIEPRLFLLGRYEREREFPDVLRAIRDLGLERYVILAGFVPDEELPDFYRACDMMIFPSLAEGFGFPPLEAMACGVPVLAGRNSSMPELFGPELELYPDNLVGPWADAAMHLLSQPEARARAIEIGLKRAASFSWDRTAKMTVEAYHYFLAGIRGAAR